MKGERFSDGGGDSDGGRRYELRHAKRRRRDIGSKANKLFGRGEKKQDLVKDFGTAILGKSDVMWGLKKPCEDELFVDSKREIFAVFDGMGGEYGGAEASKTAASAMGEILGYTNPETSENLGRLLTMISHRIERNPKAGGTTGTVGRIVTNENGKKKLIYASAGDSRIYKVSEEKATQITRDEGFGHTIWNALGLEEFEMRQMGEEELKDGDRLVFCTDGISGDTEDDFMSDKEIAQIVGGARTPAEAAKALTERAKKIDDRTAIVVEV